MEEWEITSPLAGLALREGSRISTFYFVARLSECRISFPKEDSGQRRVQFKRPERRDQSLRKINLHRFGSVLVDGVNGSKANGSI